MKQIRIITVIAFACLFFFNNAKAENSGLPVPQANVKTENYALLVSAENHIKVAVKTGEELFGNPKFNAKNFEVVICGKAVQAIKKDSEIKNIIEKGISEGIVFKACGISLGNAHIAPDELIKGIEVVPNGLIRIFELEKDGYKTIEL